MSEFQKGVSWQAGDAVTEDKLQQMVANDDWLFEHTATLRYTAYGMQNPVTENLKIAAGSILFPPNKTSDKMSRAVAFDGFFSQNCNPIVIVQAVITPGTDPRVMTAVHGLRKRHLPNSQGFRVIVSHELTKNNSLHFGKDTYLHWIAFGY